jgi:large subunit ribosomal protein L24
MNIRKNDKVKILAGKDKGKSGKVLQVWPERNKASVEGLNLLIKHMRPKRQGQKGQRIEFPAPVDASNLMVVCPRCGKASRIGQKQETNEKGKKGKKLRICKKCQQLID